MANLTILNGTVTVTGNTTVSRVQAGETIGQGSAVYLKAADSKYYNCEVSTGAAEANCTGIAVTNGVTDGYFIMATTGSYVPGATLVLGETYVVSDGGAISPIGDLTTGDYTTILFAATSTTEGLLILSTTGVAKP